MLVGVLALAGLAVKPAQAETYTYKLLHRFNHTDGAGPHAALSLDGAGNLYGTTAYGGTVAGCGNSGCGTAFQLSPDANGTWTETVLSNFGEGNDGAIPETNLVFDAAGHLYGTTTYGGVRGHGTVFQLTPGANGTWIENVIYSFRGKGNGIYPYAGLVFDGAGNLYGTTAYGGANNTAGTVFQLAPSPNDTWTETVIHSFGGDGAGSQPRCILALDGAGNLYGATGLGGAHGTGGVFELAPGTNGTWTETVLYKFPRNTHGSQTAGVILDGAGNLYGTTTNGGAHGRGTVFKLTPGANNAWTETTLHSFDGKNGAFPGANLTFDTSGNLYGTTYSGGNVKNCSPNGCGVVFKLIPGANGKWTETVLHSFSGEDGANPWAGLIFDSAGNLYGTTNSGGNLEACSGQGCGVVFEIIRQSR
jgi:uncharacterized repeat protein (TIGR03803 family)